jgi:AcrR family transcriptional regulator
VGVSSEKSGVAVRQRLTKDERRAAILEAASQVFADRGYEGASIEEIAEAAGITRPVIYDHFESKRDLHISLLELHCEQMLGFMGERVASEESAAGRMEAGLAAFFEFVETHPYAWRIVFRDPTPADEEIVAAHQRVNGRVSEALIAMIAATPIAEHPSDSVPLETAWAMWAQIMKNAAHGLAFWWYEHREVPREELVAVTMNAIWVGFERFQQGERWLPPVQAEAPTPSD